MNDEWQMVGQFPCSIFQRTAMGLEGVALKVKKSTFLLKSGIQMNSVV